MTKKNENIVDLVQLKDLKRNGTVAGDEMEMSFTLTRGKEPIVPDRIMFMDLDGTIIETKSGETFPIDTHDWQFKEGVLEKIRQYIEKGFQLCIVTNQAGIEKGFVKPLEFREKLNEIKKNIAVYLKEDYEQYHSFLGFPSKGIIASFVADSMGSKFRKPNHNWVYEAFPTLDYDKSFMVGDASGLEESFSDSDAKFAANLGIQYLDINQFLQKTFVLTQDELDVINNFIDDAPFPTPPSKQNK